MEGYEGGMSKKRKKISIHLHFFTNVTHLFQLEDVRSISRAFGPGIYPCVILTLPTNKLALVNAPEAPSTLEECTLIL
jgi:hypothetical protein